MTDTKTDYDSPWKLVLEEYFQEFMLFFFPHIHADIDWAQAHEFLNTELQKVVRDAELGKRLADKLVKVYTLTGEEMWVLIHLEIQGQAQSNFSERMFTYNYRLRDRYNRAIASLAVLVDDSQDWRPGRFSDQVWGTKVIFRFPIVKLLDYRSKWSTLEESVNPFATVAMVHLKALETKGEPLQRKDWKMMLSRRLYEKGYERQDVLNLFRFIDWLLTLPNELEDEFEQELERYEREMQMPYVTRIERRAEQRGLIKGLIVAIEISLEQKFGSEGLKILPEITQITDVQILKTIQMSLEQVRSVEELRSIYQN